MARGMENSRDETRPRPTEPCLERDQDPAQTAETDRVPATPCYETERREEFRGEEGRTVSVGGLRAVTGVASDLVSDFRFLPARCIGRGLRASPQRKSQVFFGGCRVLIPVR